MNRHRFTPILFAALLVSVAACEDDATGPTALRVVPDTLFAIGDLAELEVEVAGTASGPAVWTSLDPELLSVSRYGVARALASGSARVRAELGGRTAEGIVTVLPQTAVRVTSASLDPEDDGSQKLTLQLRNDAGRGWFRLTMYRNGGGGAPPVVVSTDLQERPVEHGLDASFTTWFDAPPTPLLRAVDFIVVTSRGAHELGPRETDCIRLDGGQGCPWS